MYHTLSVNRLPGLFRTAFSAGTKSLLGIYRTARESWNLICETWQTKRARRVWTLSCVSRESPAEGRSINDQSPRNEVIFHRQRTWHVHGEALKDYCAAIRRVASFRKISGTQFRGLPAETRQFRIANLSCGTRLLSVRGQTGSVRQCLIIWSMMHCFEISRRTSTANYTLLHPMYERRWEICRRCVNFPQLFGNRGNTSRTSLASKPQPASACNFLIELFPISPWIGIYFRSG